MSPDRARVPRFPVFANLVNRHMKAEKMTMPKAIGGAIGDGILAYVGGEIALHLPQWGNLLIPDALPFGSLSQGSLLGLALDIPLVVLTAMYAWDGVKDLVSGVYDVAGFQRRRRIRAQQDPIRAMSEDVAQRVAEIAYPDPE